MLTSCITAGLYMLLDKTWLDVVSEAIRVDIGVYQEVCEGYGPDWDTEESCV